MSDMTIEKLEQMLVGAIKDAMGRKCELMEAIADLDDKILATKAQLAGVGQAKQLLTEKQDGDTTNSAE